MITVTDEEMRSLSRAVLMRYGIDFTNYEPKSFKRRIAKVIESYGIESINNLWMKILRDPDFIYEFIDGITVGLTELFRNPGFWEELRDETLPSLHHKGTLKVWHAGCSTGEEVFSLGILLRENMYPFNVRAWATDINRQSVENSKNGRFFNTIFEKYDKNYRMFTRKPQGLDAYVRRKEGLNFFLEPGLVSHVNFGLHNLVTDKTKEKFDIIFCRNVLIYFDKTLQERVLRMFNEHLNEGGYLILGYYDSNPNSFGNLFNVVNPATKTYQKIPSFKPAMEGTYTTGPFI